MNIRALGIALATIFCSCSSYIHLLERKNIERIENEKKEINNKYNALLKEYNDNCDKYIALYTEYKNSIKQYDSLVGSLREIINSYEEED